MRVHSFSRLALAAAISMAAMSQASADWACCGCVATCITPGQYIPVLEVPNVAVAVVRPIFVVNHGPVYSGPGIVTYPAYAPVIRPWEVYPYNMNYNYSYNYNYIGPYRGWYGATGPYVKRVRAYR